MLTHWGRDNMAAISLTTFQTHFLERKCYVQFKKMLYPINNTPALVQIMAWRRPGGTPWSEAMIVSLLTHICVTRPQLVNGHNRPDHTRAHRAQKRFLYLNARSAVISCGVSRPFGMILSAQLNNEIIFGSFCYEFGFQRHAPSHLPLFRVR